MLRSPRAKFVASGHAGMWKKLMNESANGVEEAMQCALMELADTFPGNPTAQQACDSHHQLAGARKYMQILSTIHEPIIEPKTTKPTELNYKAGV